MVEEVGVGGGEERTRSKSIFPSTPRISFLTTQYVEEGGKERRARRRGRKREREEQEEGENEENEEEIKAPLQSPSDRIPNFEVITDRS